MKNGINLERVELGAGGNFVQGPAQNTVEITEAYFYDREIFIAFFDRDRQKRYLQKFEYPGDIHLLKAIAIAVELKDMKVFSPEVILGKKITVSSFQPAKGFAAFKKYVPPPPPEPEPGPVKAKVPEKPKKYVKDGYGRKLEVKETEKLPVVPSLMLNGRVRSAI